MNKYLPMRIIYVILSIAILTGCVTRGPIKEASFNSLVDSSVSNKVLLSGPGDLLPNVDGFSFFSNYDLKSRGPSAVSKGVLACTKDELVYLSWDEKNKIYKNELVIKYADMQSLELRKFGLGTRIVLTDNELGLYSLYFVENNEQFVDGKMNERAFKLMWKHKNDKS